MALSKKLETGTCLRTWNYDDGVTSGQTIGIKNEYGDYKPIAHIESVRCAEGLVNRVVIKKSFLKEKGFVIIEE